MKISSEWNKVDERKWPLGFLIKEKKFPLGSANLLWYLSYLLNHKKRVSQIRLKFDKLSIKLLEFKVYIEMHIIL